MYKFNIIKLNGVKALLLHLLILMALLSGLVKTVESNVIEPDSLLIQHISKAMKNNPRLISWQDRIEATEEQLLQAGAWNDPTVKLSLMNLPLNSFDFNQETMTAAWINVGQVVPLAGKPAIKTEIAGYKLEKTVAGRRNQELKIAEKLARIWYDWAYLHEALRTLDKNIQLLDDLIVVAMRKYETGKGLQQDILRAETARTRMEDMRVKLEQMILTTGRRFAILLGNEPDASPAPLTSLPEQFSGIDKDKLNLLLFENNPTWQGMISDLAGSRSKVELARRAYWPNLMLGAGYGYRQDSDTGMGRPDFFAATAGVSIPIYHKRKQGAKVEEMRAMERASVSRQRALELDLLLKLDKLFDEDKRLDKQILLYREGVEPQAEATLAASTATYTVGKVDFEALLMAQTALYNAQLERLARVRDRLQVRVSLAVLIGGDVLVP